MIAELVAAKLTTEQGFHQTDDMHDLLRQFRIHDVERIQLGGLGRGRKNDGEPGVKVLWRGWARLQDFVLAWSVFHLPTKDVGNV